VPDSGSSIALLFLSLGALFGASRFRSLRLTQQVINRGNLEVFQTCGIIRIAICQIKSNGVASDLLGKLGKQPKKPAQKINVLALHPRYDAPGPTVGSLLEKSRMESDGAPRTLPL
jgi:hypothetical protein